MTTREGERINLKIDKALRGTNDHAADTQTRKKEAQNEKNNNLSHRHVRSSVFILTE